MTILRPLRPNAVTRSTITLSAPRSKPCPRPAHALSGAMRGAEWFVLRTDSRNTLPLARSLTASGFEVWTPIFTQARRRPRSRSRTTLTIALIPRYIFARAIHLADLLCLSVAEDPTHRRFSVLRNDDRISLLTDADLEPLRTAETAVIPKRQQRPHAIGEKVRVPGGIFSGMTGTVESSASGFTVVAFGSVPVKFPSCQLRPDSALAA